MNLVYENKGRSQLALVFVIHKDVLLGELDRSFGQGHLVGPLELDAVADAGGIQGHVVGTEISLVHAAVVYCDQM